MTAHTPGPWVIADDGTIEAKHVGRVATLLGASEADSHLIKAAPDLFDALRCVMRHVPATVYLGVGAADDIYRAHKAIFKATGDTV